jgi:hypothetical protein
LEEVTKTGEKLMYRTQNLLGSPIFNFSSLVGKWVFASSVVINTLGRILLVTLFAAILVAGVQVIEGQAINILQILTKVITNRFFQILVGIISITSFRLILFRLGDQEV